MTEVFQYSGPTRKYAIIFGHPLRTAWGKSSHEALKSHKYTSLYAAAYA